MHVIVVIFIGVINCSSPMTAERRDKKNVYSCNLFSFRKVFRKKYDGFHAAKEGEGRKMSLFVFGVVSPNSSSGSRCPAWQKGIPQEEIFVDIAR